MKKIFSRVLKTFLFFAFALAGLQVNAQFLYISGGNQYSMVVCQDGNIKVWGTIVNPAGQDVNVSTPTTIPVSLQGLKFSQADAGSGYHLVALDCENKVWAWGRNANGQLGQPNTGSKGIPVPVIGIGGAAGSQLDNVKFVSGLNNASLALLNTGEVVAWGQNGNGQLGRGNTVDSYIPNYVMIDANTRLTNVKQVEGGDDNGYALTNDGRVYSWGDITDASLALGRPAANNTYARLVVDANGYALTGIRSIAAGDRHVLALGYDGSVWSWGGNWGPGQLGNKVTTNVNNPDKASQGYAARVLGVNGVGFLSNAEYIAAGQASSMVVLKDGSLVTFGANAIYTTGGTPSTVGGLLGHNTTSGSYFSTVPQYAKDCSGANLTNIKVVSDGDAVTYAVTFNNEVYVMGGNNSGTGTPNGVLGLGDTAPRGCATKLDLTLSSCAIPDPCPTPYLGPNISVCSASELTNITLSTTNFRSYSYKWYYRVTAQGTFQEVTIADTNVFKPTKLGQYLVEVRINQSNCVQCEIGRDTVTVDQPSINAGGFCKEQSLTFSVPPPTNGIYKWWKSATGTADSLTPRGSSYTTTLSQLTPTISGEDTVYSLYFEDLRRYNGTVGPVSGISGNNYPITDASRTRLYFNANTKIRLEAVWLRFYNYNVGAKSVTVTVNDGTNNYTVTNSINFTQSGGIVAAVRFPLGIDLNPGTGYYIQVTQMADLQLAFYDNVPASISYPYVSSGDIAGFITLIGLGTRQDGGNIGNSSSGILNWEVSGTSGGTCGRTRVSFTKDCPCNAPVPLSIISTSGPFSFCTGIPSTLTLQANPVPAVPTIDPKNYLYRWYSNGNPVQTGGDQSTLNISSNQGAATYSVRVGHTSLSRTKCYKEAEAKITVQDSLRSNRITANDTICENLPYQKRIGGAAPTGGQGDIHYAWIMSITSANAGFSIINKDSTHITPGTLTANTYFRRIATRGVCTDTSNAILIVKEPAITNPGTFEGTVPRICVGTAVPSLSYSDPSGGAFPYKFKYQWQISFDGNNWQDINAATQETLASPPNIQRSAYFRRVVTSKCSTSSASVFIKVDTAVTNNNLDQNSLSQTICIGTAAATIVGNEPTGGVGAAQYNWQQSASASGPFVDVTPASNTKNYEPGAITSTTYYKRVVTSSGACQNNISGTTAEVIVDPKVDAGSIKPSQPIVCSGASPIILNDVSASGGTPPNYTYTWQYLNGTTWTTINAPNTEGPITAPSVNDTSITSIQYRRIVKSTACYDTTATSSVSLTGKMKPGLIEASDTNICAGEVPGIINSLEAASGGTGTNLLYKWQYSLDRNTWSNIDSATSISYTPSALPGTTYFRRRATNGSGTCDTVETNYVTVAQYKVLNPGNIQASDTSICDGSSAVVREIVPASDGGPNKTYRWLISRSPFTAFKDTAVNTPTLALANLHENVRVKRITVDNCGEDTSSNTFEIKVFPKDKVIITLLTDLSQTYCGDAPLTIRASVAKAGARTITWLLNGIETIAAEDSILTIANPKNGDKVKVIVKTDPRLICTDPMTESAEYTLKIDVPTSGNTFPDLDFPICKGDRIPLLVGGTVSGGTSNPTYQWLSSSTEAGPYTEIVGANGSNYDPSGITTTTYFKRVVTSTGVCKLDTSISAVRVYIDVPVTPGFISSIDVCGSDTIPVFNQQSSTGGDGGLTYSWQYATRKLANGTPTGWSSVSGNSESLKVSIKDLDLTGTIPYFGFRRMVRSNGGVCDTFSNVVWVKVCLKPIVFDIVDTLCKNTPSDKLKAISVFDYSPNEGGILRLNPIPLLGKKTLKIDITPDSSFVYTPKTDSLGLDTAIFEICDITTTPIQCSQKRYIVSIFDRNIAPTVKPELFSTYKKQAITGFNILANDTDINKDTIYAYPSVDSLYFPVRIDSTHYYNWAVKPSKKYRDSLLLQPKHGTITMHNNGSFTYEPNLDFPSDKKIGYDTAVFWVCDFSFKQYCNEFFCQRDTVVFEVKPYRIFVPDGFSPNGDLTNDFFVIRSEIPLEMSIKVYNRWGNLVYENSDYQNDWDGRANRGLVIGEGLPDGTYYIYYDINDEEADEPVFKPITISR